MQWCILCTFVRQIVRISISSDTIRVLALRIVLLLTVQTVVSRKNKSRACYWLGVQATRAINFVWKTRLFAEVLIHRDLSNLQPFLQQPLEVFTMSVDVAFKELVNLQMAMSSDLDKRWDGAGSPWLNINKKYGYMVFALSCVNIVTIWVNSSLKVRLPPTPSRNDGKVTKLLRKWVYFPLLLQILIWAVFMILLLFIPWYQGVSTTPSYIHFKIGLGMLKRSGRIGLALYPLIIFLSLKPNPLPNVLYMHLIPFHKWISWVAISSIFIHCIGFYGFWIHKNELHRSFEKMMFPGVVNFVLLILVFIFSIKGIRESCYRVFYCLHIITAWSSLPLMYLHSMPEANLYIFGSLYLLVYHTAAKIYLSFNIRDEIDDTNSYYCTTVPGSNLILVKIPIEKVIKASTKFRREQDNSMLTYFSPGSHIRISSSFLNPKAWFFATHPYTIASLDTEEYVDLIIKKSNKFARHLASQKYFCYTSSQPFSALDEFFFTRNSNDNITIVSGGSGLAFGLPIFKYFYLRNKKAEFDEHPRTHQLRFCVVVRKIEDIFVLKESGILEHQEDPDSSVLELTSEFREAKIDIFVTGTSDVEPMSKFSRFKDMFKSVGNAVMNFHKGVLETQSYQMEDLEQSMLESSSTGLLSKAIGSVDVEVDAIIQAKEGRPHLATVLDSYHHHLEERSSVVVACGPTSLLEDCKEWTNKNNVEFVAESFSL